MSSQVRFTDEQLLELEKTAKTSDVYGPSIVLPLVWDLTDARKEHAISIENSNGWRKRAKESQELNKAICVTLRGIVQKYGLGLGGEPLDRLVSEHVEALHETITACEKEVSEVYETITRGNFAKMNTSAGFIIDAVEEATQADIRESTAAAFRQAAQEWAGMALPSSKAFSHWLHTKADELARSPQVCRQIDVSLVEEIESEGNGHDPAFDDEKARLGIG